MWGKPRASRRLVMWGTPLWPAATMYSTVAQLARVNPFNAPHFQLGPENVTLRKNGSSQVQPVRRLAAAAAVQEGEYSCEYGSAQLYAICGFGGILSCGITHTAVCTYGSGEMSNSGGSSEVQEHFQWLFSNAQRRWCPWSC
ncbi:solute carrier family 25 member 3-like [Ranitomeya imitator]|uniref:solute carrier family 25 member 3-like n=1 Tax=Ranitomeya imitator TaxID=111125 RepID=UPI0037E7A43F